MKNANLYFFPTLFLFILLPQTAFADAINFPIVMGMGLALLIPATAFVVFIEAFIISKYLKTKFKEALRFAFYANLLSLAVGIPVMIFNLWLFDKLVPKDLYSYFRMYLYYSCLAYLLYFIATVLTEFLWGIRWARKTLLHISLKTLLNAILLANIASYSVMAPLHYYGSRPTHDIKQFTSNTQWAVQPLTKIFYIDGKSNFLSQIDSNGGNRVTLVPFPMRDYMFSSDLNTFLYRGIDGHLYYYQRSNNTNKKVWATKDRYLMNRTAFSPSGNFVAYLKIIGEFKPFRLMVFNAQDNSTIETNCVTDENGYDPEIAWSIDEKTLYLKDNKKIKKILLNLKNPIVEKVRDIKNIEVNNYYGRFGRGSWWGNADWGVMHSSDSYNNLKVYAESGLGSNIIISQGDKRILFFADNPGLLHLGNRGFEDTSFISKGQECIFEDPWSIYLIDIHNKKIGKIIDGQKHVLLTPAYQQAEYFLDRNNKEP